MLGAGASRLIGRPHASLVVVSQTPFFEDDAQADSSSSQAVVVVLHVGGSAIPSTQGMHLAVALAQQFGGGVQPQRMLFLTFGVLAYGCAPSNAANGGAWGFARVLRLEHPVLDTQSADISSLSPNERLGASLVMIEPAVETELAWIDHVLFSILLCTTE